MKIPELILVKKKNSKWEFKKPLGMKSQKFVLNISWKEV